MGVGGRLRQPIAIGYAVAHACDLDPLATTAVKLVIMIRVIISLDILSGMRKDEAISG